MIKDHAGMGKELRVQRRADVGSAKWCVCFNSPVGYPILLPSMASTGAPSLLPAVLPLGQLPLCLGASFLLFCNDNLVFLNDI